jgi:hypothetical protein
MPSHVVPLVEHSRRPSLDRCPLDGPDFAPELGRDHGIVGTVIHFETPGCAGLVGRATKMYRLYSSGIYPVSFRDALYCAVRFDLPPVSGQRAGADLGLAGSGMEKVRNRAP